MSVFLENHLYYRLVENKLSSAGGAKTFTGQVTVSEPLREEQLKAEMCLANPLLNPNMIEMVWDETDKAQIRLLKKGHNLITRFGHYILSILGSCTEEEMKKDPNPLKTVGISIAVPTSYKEAADSITTVHDQSATEVTAPTLSKLHDGKTKTFDKQVTRDGLITLTGDHTKYDESKLDQGIFFVPVGGGTAIRVTDNGLNEPKKQIFKAPAELVIGTDYNVELRTIQHNSSALKVAVLKAIIKAV